MSVIAYENGLGKSETYTKAELSGRKQTTRKRTTALEYLACVNARKMIAVLKARKHSLFIMGGSISRPMG